MRVTISQSIFVQRTSTPPIQLDGLQSEHSITAHYIFFRQKTRHSFALHDYFSRCDNQTIPQTIFYIVNDHYKSWQSFEKTTNSSLNSVGWKTFIPTEINHWREQLKSFSKIGNKLIIAWLPSNNFKCVCIHIFYTETAFILKKD